MNFPKVRIFVGILFELFESIRISPDRHSSFFFRFTETDICLKSSSSTKRIKGLFLPHLPPFRLRKFRVALRVNPPRLPKQRVSKICGETGYLV